MIFNSVTFFLFLIIVLFFYYNLDHKKQNIFLVLTSYVFYGAWDSRFLILIILSTVVDYFLSLKIEQSRTQAKKYLLLSISFNLLVLGFFKYFNFFIDSSIDLITSLGFSEPQIFRLDIILPVGISFYTFQTMSYTIDVYRKEIQPIKDYIDYSLYVAFFPQLVAGPIERAVNLIPQIQKPRIVKRSNIDNGFWLITRGLFKKVVISDNLAPIVNSLFNDEIPDNGFYCLIGIYAFTYQIYCDFSGYSDIARGVSKLLGFELMLNFNLPYLARNPQEFWNKWHISLSTWLRDYLYIPLGGNRGGNLKTYRNLLITMVLGGLWHGAAWNFIIWGFFHGLALGVHRFFFGRDGKTKSNNKYSFIKIVLMFHFTCVGWLIFRATSSSQILSFLHQIFLNFTIDRKGLGYLSTLVLFTSLLWVMEILTKNKDDLKKLKYYNPFISILGMSALWLLIYILAPIGGQAFIYFQF